MRRLTSLAAACIIAIFSVAVFARVFASAVLGSVPGQPSNATDVGTVRPMKQMPLSYPKTMSIPAIRVTAHIQDVGITAKGAIGSPSNFSDVGWYEYGTLPGKKGNALIDGHVDNGLALAGVFKHLDSLVVGDHIYVTDYGGKRFDFVVSKVAVYDMNDVPMQEILQASGTPMLSLMTCGGQWIGAEKTYDKRIVVTSVLE